MTKYSSFKNDSGFTFPEIIISMGIFIVLISIVVVSLFRAQSSSVSSANIDVLVSDIRSQQIKAMKGEENDDQISDFGIYFPFRGGR